MFWFLKKKNSSKTNQNSKKEKVSERSSQDNQQNSAIKVTSKPTDGPTHILEPAPKKFPESNQGQANRAVLQDPKIFEVHAPRNTELPHQYGDNLIHIMVRDPYWLYSYWEIQQEHQMQALQQLGGDWNCVRSILRVHDVSDGSSPKFFDIT